MKKNQILDEIENLAYENKKMGEFIEKLGLTCNDITDLVINGTNEEQKELIQKIKGGKR